MTGLDWRWKIAEAAERIRTRYQYIGRKTGAPFMAIVYSPEAEVAFLKEWRTQVEALRPEIDIRTLNILDITQRSILEIGVENIVSSIKDPMPGSDPESELGQLWISCIIEAVQDTLSKPGTGKPVICLERLAALYPATGPRQVMQNLWDIDQSRLDAPMVILIPGYLKGIRTYSFVGKREEFMYRGDLL